MNDTTKETEIGKENASINKFERCTRKNARNNGLLISIFYFFNQEMYKI